MPNRYKVQTWLTHEDGVLFSNRAKELRISDYELAKEMIEFCLHEREGVAAVSLKRRIMAVLDNIP